MTHAGTYLIAEAGQIVGRLDRPAVEGLVEALAGLRDRGGPRPRAALNEIRSLSRGRAFVAADSHRTLEQRESFLPRVLTPERHDHTTGGLARFGEAGCTGDRSWIIVG